MGRRWVDTVSTDTRRKIELLLDELSTTSISQRREVNHPIVDGDAVPMAWTAIRLGEHGRWWPSGANLRAVAAIQRRFLDSQHEMELDYWQRRHADNRYRTLFQVARDAVMVLDADSFRVVECNDAARRLLDHGGPARGRRGVAARTRDRRRARAAGRASGHGAQQWPRWRDPASHGRAGPHLGRLGHPLHHGRAAAACSCERVIMTRAAADSQPAVMRALVESTTDAVVITDSAGHIQMANPAFLALVQQPSEVRVKGQGLADIVGDADGRWQDMMARTRLQGLCPRTPLTVQGGELGIDVEVVSTVLTDGDQELLGYTLRTVEPARPVTSSTVHEAWPELDALRAQVGLVPLATLLQEASEAVERQMIQKALRLASGHVGTAARLLFVNPQSLTLRMHGLDLAGLSERVSDDDDRVPPSPQRMN